MSNAPQSVERALQILLSFETEEQDVSIGELASLLEVHKSTASRLAGTLSRHGLLERTPGNDRFRLGPQVARLGQLALAGRDLLDVARAPMGQLATVTDETVTLAVLNGDGLTTVAQVDSQHVIGPRSWIGRRTLLHTTSDGKVFLAFGGAPIPEGPLAALTPRTVTRRDALRRELSEVRQRGWAQAVGELEDGLHGVAAPVLDAGGRCRAALSVSGPAYRMAPERLPQLAGVCVEAAARIGAQLVDSTTGAAATGGGGPNI
jgi:IclR family transcriptional regulator, acetate operon repressor